MDTRPRSSAALAKTVLLLFALIMVTILLLQGPLTASVGRVQGERVFENGPQPLRHDP